MARPFHVGDRVKWNTPQGETQGKVVEVKTRDFQLYEHQFRASEEDPRYIVESDRSGPGGAHGRGAEQALTRPRPSALKVTDVPEVGRW